MSKPLRLVALNHGKVIYRPVESAGAGLSLNLVRHAIKFHLHQSAPHTVPREVLQQTSRPATMHAIKPCSESACPQSGSWTSQSNIHSGGTKLHDGPNPFIKVGIHYITNRNYNKILYFSASVYKYSIKTSRVLGNPPPRFLRISEFEEKDRPGRNSAVGGCCWAFSSSLRNYESFYVEGMNRPPSGWASLALLA